MAELTYKPVDELARALPSFKRSLLSVVVTVGMSNDILSNSPNIHAVDASYSLFYAARCNAWVAFAYVMKNAMFVGVRSRQMLLIQRSKPNELIFSTMFYVLRV